MSEGESNLEELLEELVGLDKQIATKLDALKRVMVKDGNLQYIS